MDIYLLDGFLKDEPRPPDATTIHLDFDQPHAGVEALELGALSDQDANNLPEVQKGLKASKSGKAYTARYQELRIRHFHQTLARYLAEMIQKCLLLNQGHLSNRGRRETPPPNDERRLAHKIAWAKSGRLASFNQTLTEGFADEGVQVPIRFYC